MNLYENDTEQEAIIFDLDGTYFRSPVASEKIHLLAKEIEAIKTAENERIATNLRSMLPIGTRVRADNGWIYTVCEVKPIYRGVGISIMAYGRKYYADGRVKPLEELKGELAFVREENLPTFSTK